MGQEEALETHTQNPVTKKLEGGWSKGKYFRIDWSSEDREDGATVEVILFTVLKRLRLKQTFKSQRTRNNAIAITHIEDALLRLTEGKGALFYNDIEGLNYETSYANGVDNS